MSGWETGWGLELLVFMNNLGGRFLDIVFEPLAFLGGQWGYVLLLPIIFWSVDDRLGRRLFALVMGSALLNGVLKAWWARPRPYQVAPERIVPAHVESSYGMPSGHTQGGTVLGLFFARESRRQRVRILMYALIFLMGISRMVHGVHFLQDVLTGWLAGGAVFAFFVCFETRYLQRLRSWNLWALTAASLIPAVLAVAGEFILKGSYPATKSLLATGGAFSGILLGISLETRRGFYRSAGPPGQRILRVAVGILITAGLNLALSRAWHAAVSVEPGFGGIVTYALRYTLVGFTGSWLIPELFVRTGLAGAREKGRPN